MARHGIIGFILMLICFIIDEQIYASKDTLKLSVPNLDILVGFIGFLGIILFIISYHGHRNWQKQKGWGI